MVIRLWRLYKRPIHKCCCRQTACLFKYSQPTKSRYHLQVLNRELIISYNSHSHIPKIQNTRNNTFQAWSYNITFNGIMANSNTYGAFWPLFLSVPNLTFKWFNFAGWGPEEATGVTFSLVHVIAHRSLRVLNRVTNENSRTFGPALQPRNVYNRKPKGNLAQPEILVKYKHTTNRRFVTRIMNHPQTEVRSHHEPSTDRG
jgi:hypothetical protein